MTPAAATTASVHEGQSTSHMSWFAKSEAWLDSKGKGAWIAAMVLGFVFVWPVGLALLFYMIWSKKMFTSCSKRSTRHHSMRRAGHAAMKTSGNRAFDSYKTETLRRLEDEQEQFETFLERLREAKDKAEFDEFMDERARKARAATEAPVEEKEDA